MLQLQVMADSEEYQRRVATTVMQAIFEASLVEEDGEPTAYVVAKEAVAALINVIASLLVDAPGCETPKAMRELAERVGRKTFVQMREMRKIIDTTGIRPFEAVYTRTD